MSLLLPGMHLGISDREKYLIVTVNSSSDLLGTACTRAGPCLGA